ncbi:MULTISPECIES: lysine exporter LysO family protein [unclassified Cobetia]|uniref:lysine exporter LysO family protein n=1 Tax=unclassified Cobetia TaxID=2609414 RepID=UPI002097C38D|nr:MULTISPECIES: lysine exporter LysO family protein [unclassified Cobetia]MCO7234019.1 lysine exporter LysO family protein [Cobetia sp. Dlab-2-AX]MCO7237243.1 lysine exporter LysO family protein [Cobetia sp. Dlab-2-U]
MLSGLIFILLPLILGYLVRLTDPGRLAVVNRLVNASIYLILFLMGMGLAALEQLSVGMAAMSGQALTLFAIITPLNLLALWWLSRRSPLRANPAQAVDGAPITRWQALSGSLTLAAMVALGVGAGVLLKTFGTQLDTDTLAEWALYVLLALIGCQLRSSGMSLRQILLNRHGLVIALTVMASSLLGGLLAAPLLALEWNQGMAISAGFGWYSLSGILIGDQLGPILGGAAFFNDLARELLAFVLIPLTIQRYTPLAIGIGGATSMDFTLPVIQQTGGVACVPVAVVSGFLLSLAAPPMMLFLLSLSHV